MEGIKTPEFVRLLDVIIINLNLHNIAKTPLKGGSRTAVTSKMERFVIIVNGCKPFTIITKRSILDVVAALDPPL